MRRFSLPARMLFTTGLSIVHVAMCVEPNADHNFSPEIRTPKAPLTPRLNGPGQFGVRPGHPFFYQIPATGERPMNFSARNLPIGLALDSKSGLITGALKKN